MTWTCFFCGSTLSEETSRETCLICGQVEESDLRCPNGHYLCEDCRLAEPRGVIERACAATTSSDPVEIADRILLHPHFRDHGPHHHLLAAPVLVTALRNAGYAGLRPESATVAWKRMADVPAAVCGLRGDCGASVGVGAALSVATRAHHRSDVERSSVLLATSRALADLAALGGPRCCRMSAYAALETGRAVFRETLGVDLPGEPGRCRVAGRLPDCHGPRCPFHA